MLEAEILASKIKFHIFYFPCELANLILAIWFLSIATNVKIGLYLLLFKRANSRSENQC